MKFCVIGGGLLGMTLAHRLAQKDHAVHLWEAGSKLGGLASTWQIGGVEWDRHYHVILASDSYLRSLLNEIGLERELVWKSTKTGFWVDGQMHPFTTPVDLLRFPGLSVFDKLRLGTTIFGAARRSDGLPFERTLVADWLVKWSGRQGFERFWRPVLESKLRENYKITSAAFIWATIRRLFAARRAGIQEQFGYVQGGYRRILERLKSTLTGEGVEIRTDMPVTKVEAAGNGVQVTARGGFEAEFDRVIWTTAAPPILAACEWLTNDERERLSGIRYQGIVCASVLLEKPLGPYYVTNIADPDVPFTGVIEMSTIVPPTAFGGRSLVYLPNYADPSDPIFNKTDADIKEMFVTGIERMYSHFKRSDIVAFQVSRVRHVFAIPTLGYSRRLPPIQTSNSNVFLLNSAHIVNATLNVNEAVQLVEHTLQTIAG